MNAHPYAPSIRMLSVVSISDIPAANSTGNTRIETSDSPFDASAAEIPNSPISVAVSKPSPNSTPSGYMCQLRVMIRNMGRKSLDRKPRSASSISKSSSTYGAPPRTRTNAR